MNDVEEKASDKTISVDEIQNLRTKQARQRRLYLVGLAVISAPAIIPMIGVFLDDYDWFRPIADAFYKYFKWFFAFYIAGFVIFIVPMMMRQNRMQQQIEDARLGIVNISSELADDLESKLIALNLKYQDRYYLETGLQANKSFLASLIVAVLGFIMISVAIVLFFKEKVPAASVSVASGVITEFISALFFYLFNKTVLSMASYHQRLLFTQNIALALKLVHSLPEDKRERLIEMIVAELTRDLNLHLAGVQPGLHH